MSNKVEQIKTEKTEKQPKVNGGARIGAGRKKGGQNKSTKDRLEALQQFKDRVAKHVDRLFNAQSALAEGVSYMYRVEIRTNKAGKEIEEHILVTDPNEIKLALDGGLKGVYGVNYYYITAERPDNKAIDSLLDRTYGKPEQAVKHSGDEENPVRLVLD